MSDPIQASSLGVENCGPECECQSVHLDLKDVDGDVFATASMTTNVARAVAADILRTADLADARRAQLRGRVQ